MKKGWILVCGLLLLSCGSTSSEKDVAARADTPVIDQTASDVPSTDLPADGQVVDTPSVPDVLRAEDLPLDETTEEISEPLVDVIEPDIVVEVEPGPEFDKWCDGKEWEATQVAAVVGEVTGAYVGVYNEFPALTQEMMKVIPEHPFYVTKIRVAFAGTGKARVRLMHTFGRSYPASWEKLGEPEANLMEPIDIEMEEADPEVWTEINVANRGIMLEPTQHYAIVYQHFDNAPYVAVAEIADPSEEKSRGLIIVPGEFEAYGLGDANFRMELEGFSFCQWEEEQFWFEESAAPFSEPGHNRASIADLNGDGHDDVVTFATDPVAFLGDGAGGFAAADPPLFPGGLGTNNLVLGDLDNDGDIDAFASTWTDPEGENPNRILRNDNEAGFVAVEDSGVESFDPTGAAALGDGNNDGILDIYWGNWLVTYPEAPAYNDKYMVGHGDGTYTDMTEAAGMIKETAEPCYGVSWTDVNNDGLAEVWVGNYQFKDNFLFWNLGDGTFEDRAEELGLMKDAKGFWGGHTYGGDWGDFDNDGDLDLFEPNLSHPRTMPYSDDSRLLVNQGPPDYDFVDKAEEFGFIYDEGDVNAAWGDYDNDGDLDIAVSALYQNHYFKFYRNDGDHFTDITYESNLIVNDAVGAVWSDVDEDGDLDLIVMDRMGAQRVQLFTNRVGQENNWLELDLVGTTANRDAIGARVVVEAGGIKMTRLVKGGGRHMNAQDSHTVHFGLGQADAIDSVTVYWPGGEAEEFDGLSMNERHALEQSL